ncbi:MAG: HepT-like ribonuclease domain-containing protein [Aquificaceae bacterium]
MQEEKKRPKVSLILESFSQLEKAYGDIKKNLNLGKEEFLSNKLLQDKVRVDFNLAFESCMRVCRHLSAVYNLRTTSKDCLQKIGQLLGMERAEDLGSLTEFYIKYRDIKEGIPPEELYDFLYSHLPLFKDYAKAVVEFVKRETNNPLLIDFDLLKEKAGRVKESVKKINFVLSQGEESFCQSPMYYDRVKYFYHVAYDSLFDICKHLAGKFGIKKFGDDCLIKMLEAGVIPKEYNEPLSKMASLKNKLISTWDIPPQELYRALLEIKDSFEPLLKEIANSLKRLIEERKGYLG